MMLNPFVRFGACFVLLAALAACGSSQSVSSPDGGSGDGNSSGDATDVVDSAAAQCILDSSALQVGTTADLVIDGTTITKTHQPDAPSALETPIDDAGAATGSCAGNEQFRFGTGIYDTTGPIGGNPTGHGDMFGMVVPPQAPKGIDTRLYARAFDIESPCNGKRVVFVSVDLGAMSAIIHQEVLKKLAADATLGGLYTADNVMISATHTHTAPGGFGVPELPDLSSTLPEAINDPVEWVESLIFSDAAFDSDNFNAIVNGIVEAIRRAHANLETHGDSAPIRMSISQLLNANVNRSPPAYAQNAESERAQYLDENGHEVNVDKRFLQLSLIRNDGKAAGVLNWFAVHPTSMGNHDLLISSDNKGWAALRFEKLMGTQYTPDSSDTPDGTDNFVASFAQTDEGDTIPDLFVFDADIDGGNGPGQGVPYGMRGGTDEPYEFDEPGYQYGQPEAAAINGTKQLAQALSDFGQGTALHGPVDYRFFYADFSDDEVTDPEVLADLQAPGSPDDLYTGDKTTCTTALGFGFAVGGVNGPGPGAAGFTCVNDAPSEYKTEIRTGYNGLFNGTGYLTVEQNDTPIKVPLPGVLVTAAVTPVLCLQTLTPGYSCQKEKPVFTPSETDPVPFQIFRIGNLAVLGVPFEVTTMAGRRLRKTVLDALSPAGVDTVVIAGLSNDYLHYMATREEYSAQMYEGASTYAGPWQLAATQQEARKLALTMASGEPAPTGVAATDITIGNDAPITTDVPGDYGSIVTDANASYTQGDEVDVTWVAGYPGNDLKTMASYLYAERENADGSWTVVATDKDPELRFVWNTRSSLILTELNLAGSSTAEALWKLPLNLPAGTYRLRHEGVYRTSASEPPTPYEALSSPFTVSGTPASCPS
ncbi:neutral/alkaline non-lysosomal ceramidase N-terminal domain-containing protein [Solimonas marina]|uniref:Neutral ceramidase n=1 Tax=Solimonas marina TaxID=2714601 RepID=A0A969WBZ8_9GAMM|nr:neutral/alkaline non-lysosomal ceramidase N-terminal domain-containing protein [Solimonas marina]NKF23744.1 neutral/alkaline ceramidase [Solimonas marina]